MYCVLAFVRVVRIKIKRLVMSAILKNVIAIFIVRFCTKRRKTVFIKPFLVIRFCRVTFVAVVE
jgi:uncharacterized membrane protein